MKTYFFGPDNPIEFVKPFGVNVARTEVHYKGKVYGSIIDWGKLSPVPFTYGPFTFHPTVKVGDPLQRTPTYKKQEEAEDAARTYVESVATGEDKE